MLVKNVSKSILLDIVKKLELPFSIDEEGRIWIRWDACQDFLNHNIDICLSLEDTTLTVLGCVYDFEFDDSYLEKALITVNEYNKMRSSLTAYAIQNNIIVSRTERIDKPVSDEFIEYVIGTVIADSVKAFVYFEKKMFY